MCDLQSFKCWCTVTILSNASAKGTQEKKELENLILLDVEGSMTGNLEFGISLYKFPVTPKSSENLDVAHTQILINDLFFFSGWRMTRSGAEERKHPLPHSFWTLKITIVYIFLGFSFQANSWIVHYRNFLKDPSTLRDEQKLFPEINSLDSKSSPCCFFLSCTVVSWSLFGPNWAFAFKSDLKFSGNSGLPLREALTSFTKWSFP